MERRRDNLFWACVMFVTVMTVIGITTVLGALTAR